MTPTIKQRPDFASPKNPSKNQQNDSFYDAIDDYDLIEASFAQQYGIRLRIEESMSWGEFSTLLAGLNHKTPLGEIVAIRKENDPEVLKKFTPQQRKIRNDYRRKQALNMDKSSYDVAMKRFSAMFKAIGQKGNQA